MAPKDAELLFMNDLKSGIAPLLYSRITKPLAANITGRMWTQIKRHVSLGNLREDAANRLSPWVQQSKSDPTMMDVGFMLDGVDDPEAILKMSDWKYPSAEALAEERRKAHEALGAKRKEWGEKDAERRRDLRDVGNMMADRLEEMGVTLRGGWRVAWDTLITMLRNGGPDDTD